MDSVLDPSIIKDLSNHIYEKRKATALQIEIITKNAYSRNDALTIHKIIEELTVLTNGTPAKMGAITALGSVSVALGALAIAYYLEEITKPIFAAFKDTDARVRYYACESLYNIAKIARGEILLYFNEVFDILCILVSDTESSVKNAADILDRLIKDIVSAKATSYVSILQKPSTDSDIASHIIDANGRAIQVNNVQNTKKAFSLVKFIPTLLERMYTLDPFARTFLLSWLDLLDDLPSLELITFLPNFLNPLINFLNDVHQDVRIETHKLLNTFLKEIQHIHQVKLQVKQHIENLQKQKELEQKEEELQKSKESEKADQLTITVDSKFEPKKDDSDGDKANDVGDILQDLSLTQDPDETLNSTYTSDGLFLAGQDIYIDYPKIIEILISFLNSQNLEIQFIVLKWIEEILIISPSSFLKFLPKILSVLLKTLASNNDDLRENAKVVNSNLHELISNLHTEDEFSGLNLNQTLNSITQEYITDNETSRIAALDWLILLQSKTPQTFNLDAEDKINLQTLLKTLTDPAPEVIVKILQLLSQISESDTNFFSSFMAKLIDLFKQDPTLSNEKYEFILRKLCVTLDSEKIYKSISEALSTETNLEFVSSMIQTLNTILITANELSNLRKKLKSMDTKEDWLLFSTLFKSWCHNAPSALSLCLLTQNYELSYLIVLSIADLEINFSLLTQLDILVQMLESPIFMKLRLQLLEPDKHPYLYKALYGLLMLLPQTSTFNSLQNRLSAISSINNLSSPSFNNATASSLPPSAASQSAKRKRVGELLELFKKIQNDHEKMRLENNVKSTNDGEKKATASAQSARTPFNAAPSREEENKQALVKKNSHHGKDKKRKASGRFALNRFGGNGSGEHHK